MILTTVHCPARGKRVEASDCYERHLVGNAKLAVTPEAVRRCRRCPAGARNRARYAAEGDRIGWSERGWPQELREAMERSVLTPSGRGQKYLDTAGKGR